MSRKIAGQSPVTRLPAGSTDCHIHVYGEQYKTYEGLAYPDDHADLDMYLKVQQWLGIERVVVVQSNAHRADNRCILDALAHLGDKARGVAVVTPDTSDAELASLHRQGVRGARIMQLLGGTVGLNDMLEVNAKIAPLGWHNIVQFDGREMLQHRSKLEQMQGDFIIDHAGKFLQPVAVNDPAFKALLELIDRGNCYVKLAGCYETSVSGAPHYEDLAVMSKALIAHAPERIIWGSNWPHTMSPPSEAPDDGKLLDLVCGWIPDQASLQQIFVDNPARLYGFTAPSLPKETSEQLQTV